MLTSNADDKATLQVLKSLPEEQKLIKIKEIIHKDLNTGLKLASSVLQTKISLRVMLEQGLEQADASEIELWLKYLIPPIGFRGVLNILKENLHTNIKGVAKAAYWLPKLLTGNNEKDKLKLQELLREVHMLGGEYKSVNSSGRAFKLVLKDKLTGELVIFGGYQVGSAGTGIVVEILDPDNYYLPTGGMKLVKLQDLEILDPQPYND